MPAALSSSTSRREARRTSRREAILDVAANSFLVHGYTGTTMSSIAATLGGSKGTLWSYFPSKEVLFAAMMDRSTEHFRAQLSLILNPHDEVEQTLRRFCAEFLRKVVSPDAVALYRLVTGEANRFPELGKIFQERGPKGTQRLLADYMARAMDKGALRQCDPLIAAQQLISLSLSGFHQQLVMGAIETIGGSALSKEVDRAMDTFMRAFGPASPS